MDPELVVKFKGDTSDLDKAFARVKGQLDGVPGAMGKASKAGDNLASSNNNLNNSFGNLVKGYIGLQAVMAGGKMFIDATKEVQKFENQLKVASGTQEDYGKNMAFLEGLADKYKKNVVELGASFSKLTIATKGTNMEGEKTERLFAAVTATSSALQMSVDETNGTFQAFIQMVSKGNVQAEELRGQLGERLYGAFNLAAKSMGVTTSELNKMLERGEVLASDLLPKLTVELENTFGEIAQKNANNLGSNIDYATGQATLFFAELGKSSGITEGLNSMASAMGGIFNKLRALNKESSITDGFFDRLFTMPGGSFNWNNGAGRDDVKGASDAALNKALVNLGKGSYVKPFSAAQSNTDTSSYGAQFGIHDRNKKAEDTIKRQNEIAANKASAALNRWVSDQIQQSKDRIAQAMVDMEYNRAMAASTGHSSVGTPSKIKSGGISDLYDPKTYETSGTQLSNPIMGDGSMNFDHLIENMSLTVDKVIAEQNRLKGATDDFGASLDAAIKASLSNAIVSTAEGIGQIAAGLATGTATLGDVGNTFLGIVAGLFQQIGEALSTWAATIILADVAIGSMNPAGALVGAALAFGAAAVARSQMQQSSEQAFWGGGIVQGRGGVDNVHTALTPGEMVLNGSQQNRLWGLVSGAHSGREFAGAAGGHGASEDINVNVRGRFRGTDIHMSGEQGRKKNNYYN